MRIIGPSSEEEMVAVFLRGELSSDRFAAGIRQALHGAGAGERFVTTPDLADAAENALRMRILGQTRRYARRAGLFGGFPHDVRWERVALSPDELLSVRYIEYDYWVELSDGSRLPLDAARRIREGVKPFGVPTDGFLAAAERVGEAWPPLIVCSAGADRPLVVL